MISSTAHHLLGVEAYEEILLGRSRRSRKIAGAHHGVHGRSVEFRPAGALFHLAVENLAVAVEQKTE